MNALKMGIVAVVMVVAVAAGAASFDGTYQFTSRSKEGTPDMAGWWGMMIITNGTMSPIYHSPDATQEKYYVGTLTPTGNLYTIKFTQAYKPEYIGNEHRNKITVDGAGLVVESEDGKFKEVWTKK